MLYFVLVCNFISIQLISTLNSNDNYSLYLFPNQVSHKFSLIHNCPCTAKEVLKYENENMFPFEGATMYFIQHLCFISFCFKSSQNCSVFQNCCITVFHILFL